MTATEMAKLLRGFARKFAGNGGATLTQPEFADTLDELATALLAKTPASPHSADDDYHSGDFFYLGK